MSSNSKLQDDYRRACENIDRSYLVSASAGTGKTRVLVNRYLNILQQNQAGIDEIIAITFTEKAATEMKERIRHSIRQERPTDSRMIDHLSTAPISTIHSFCARVLQENVDEIGIDPQFRIIDEVEEQILRKEKLTIFLHKKMVKKDAEISALLQHFDLFQIREMLTIIWENQQDYRSILDHFRRMSTQQLYERTRKHYQEYSRNLLQEAFQQPEIKQACQFLQQHNAINPEDSFQLVKTRALTVIKQIQKGEIPLELRDGTLSKVFSLGKKGRKENWGAELGDMRENFKKLRSAWDTIEKRLFGFDDAMEQSNAELLINFANLAIAWIQYYRDVQNENGVVDFNGLEVLTEMFFEADSPSAKQYVRRYKHLLVDEFQDISPVQDRILRSLCKLNPGIISFYVGDEKQSIYRFRGAEIEIFNRYKQRRDLLYLDINYRSALGLNEFYNRFFGYLMQDCESLPPFEVTYEKPVKSADKTSAAQVSVELLLLNTDDANDRSDPDLSDTDAEFIHVVQTIQNLRSSKIIRDHDGKMRTPQWRDFAILLRSRTHQGQLEAVLHRAGVPFYVRTGIGFYQRREVLDMINFLRVLINFYDEIALVGTLRSPLVGLSDDDLMALASEDGLIDGIQRVVDEDFDHVGNFPDAIRQFQQFLTIYRRLQEKMSRLTTAQILQTILDETHYLAVLAAFPEEKQSIANVHKLIDLAVEWSQPRDISPVDFIRRVQLYQSMEIREGEANLSSEIEDSVTIMTIHGAKGLSFPVVIIPELSARRHHNFARLLSDRNEEMAFNLKTTFNDYHGYYYQYLSKCEKERGDAEEKRILYVAATRAESHLVFSAIDTLKRTNPLWSDLKPFFDQSDSGVPVREMTLCEAADLVAKFKGQSHKIPQILSPQQRIDISRMIQPLPPHHQRGKVTPTAFASWLSAEISQSLPYEKYDRKKPVNDENQSLSALDIGSIIHQAFSWWDFKNGSDLCQFTEQLMKPFMLPAREKRHYLELFRKWGQTLIEPDNGLAKYIRDASEIAREVDIYSWLFNTLLEGTIDLLLRMKNDEYFIIDFKSDYIKDKPGEAMMFKYNAQLDLYALMLSRSTNVKVGKTGLYFIRNGLLIERESTAETRRNTEKQLTKYIQSG